ncbi:MAG: hypothetical protein RMY36_019310 [Nostoc sp. SerVER01]|nr:hypothetical protein [Nostoc sp. SerVER01]
MSVNSSIIPVNGGLNKNLCALCWLSFSREPGQLVIEPLFFLPDVVQQESTLLHYLISVKLALNTVMAWLRLR